MAAIYPSDYSIQAYLGGSWQDITASVIGTISANWGIPRPGPIDLVAATGTLRFTLKNGDGIYSPNSTAPISADWKKGCSVRLVITYDGITRVWYGAIEDFDFDASGPRTRGKVTVTVVDWMDRAAKAPIDYPDLQIDKKSDEAAIAIVALMPTAPQQTAYYNGVYNFPVIFDTVTDFTYARTELSKIALSETCYIYVRHNGSVGEKLIVENATLRATAAPVIIPLLSTEPNVLIAENDDTLIAENGDTLIAESSEVFSSVNDALRVESSYGDNVINDVRFRYTLRQKYTAGGALDEKGVAFFSYRANNFSSILIEAGQTKKFSFKYPNLFRDGDDGYPSFFAGSGDSDSRKVGPPLPTAFFERTMFTGPEQSNPPNTDISTDLQIISIDFKLDRLDISLKNNNASNGYATFAFQMPSGGIMVICSPDEQVTVQDASSIAENDYQPISFDMVYQTTATAGNTFANRILAKDANPRTTLDRLHYSANRSPHNMIAFMSLDIGDKFRVVDTNKGIDAYFFIQSMAFTIEPGGIINFSIGLVDNYATS